MFDPRRRNRSRNRFGKNEIDVYGLVTPAVLDSETGEKCWELIVELYHPVGYYIRSLSMRADRNGYYHITIPGEFNRCVIRVFCFGGRNYRSAYTTLNLDHALDGVITAHQIRMIKIETFDSTSLVREITGDERFGIEYEQEKKHNLDDFYG